MTNAKTTQHNTHTNTQTHTQREEKKTTDFTCEIFEIHKCMQKGTP